MKILKCGVCMGVFCVLGACGLYAYRLSETDCVTADFPFYYLTVEESGAEACAQMMRLEGGAGYFLDDKVVLAVYFTLYDAQSVREKVLSEYPDASILSCQAGEIYLEGETADTSLAAFGVFYRQLQELNGLATKLDNGWTQQRAKKYLDCLRDSMSTLQKTYAQVKGYTVLCDTAYTCLDEMRDDVLLSREIRYTVCDLSQVFLLAVKHCTL